MTEAGAIYHAGELQPWRDGVKIGPCEGRVLRSTRTCNQIYVLEWREEAIVEGLLRLRPY